MSNTSAKAAQEAAREEEQRKRNLLISILDTLPRGPSDRDTLAEKAMVAYLLTYATKDYDVVANYAYKMADAMIAERKNPAQPTA
jgi:predicted component of type VI protein secretion system